MAKETKPLVLKEESFDLLDIRVGKVLEVELEPSAPKKSYRLRIDFGGYGIKTSVARLTQHSADELLGQLVLAVLNFPPRQVGDVLSEVLTLGVQLPKVDSGEATFITTARDVRVGSKLS
ncbi:MAG: tRNA-binding protein [Chlamydiales bacterium]|nr:tRNA-binding protein [Chlamydiales bacterium]